MATLPSQYMDKALGLVRDVTKIQGPYPVLFLAVLACGYGLFNAGSTTEKIFWGVVVALILIVFFAKRPADLRSPKGPGSKVHLPAKKSTPEEVEAVAKLSQRVDELPPNPTGELVAGPTEALAAEAPFRQIAGPYRDYIIDYPPPRLDGAADACGGAVR